MKIQIVSNKTTNYNCKYNITYSSLNKPKSLDSYDINIFSLQDSYIWQYRQYNEKMLVCTNDLKSIKQMIYNSRKAVNIIALPQNYTHSYNFSDNRYIYKIELKNEIDNLIRNLLSSIIPDCMNNMYNLIYENSVTKLNKSKFNSAFCFINYNNVLSKSEGGNKATTINYENLILTTLDISSPDVNLEDFIIGIGLDNEKIQFPQWLLNIQCFDDAEQQELIDISNEEIRLLNDKIENANNILEKNLKYKSILATNGDELVSVVFEILEKILDCNLSDFIDEKKEDFLIKKDNISFIGEIKGVTSNVKSEHVSQLDVHFQSYLDKLNESNITENVKAILIINPFRTKPLTEREAIHKIQIDLAIRNGSLIITTKTLLDVFEMFLANKIKAEKIISVFSNTIGLLDINSFVDKERIKDNDE